MEELVSKKKLTTHYVAALVIVGVTTLVSHYTVLKSLNENEGSAQIINTSGRQRMLSQRIASLAAEHALGYADARRELNATIQRFETENAALGRHVSGLQGHSKDHLQLQRIYDDGLAGEVATFIAQARKVAGMETAEAAKSSELAALCAAAQTPLLAKLDGVVTHQQHIAEQQIADLAALQKITLAVILLTLLVEALAIFRPMVNRVVDYAARLLHLANVDELTKVNNRRAFVEQAQVEINRSRRYSKPLVLLMLDVDHFKRVNDTFGHGGGDAALRALATHLQHSLRTSDFVGRLGGEEFAVVLPDTGLDSALQLAERLRAAIEALSIPQERKEIRFSISIGVAALSAELSTLEALMQAADKALYDAKGSGRNQVVVYRKKMLVAVPA